MSDTDLLENEVLKLILGKALSLTLPITPYLALYTTKPADDGTGGVEVTGGGYARIAITSKFDATGIARIKRTSMCVQETRPR